MEPMDEALAEEAPLSAANPRQSEVSQPQPWWPQNSGSAIISKAILKLTYIETFEQLTELVPGSDGGVARISGADMSRAACLVEAVPDCPGAATWSVGLFDSSLSSY
jgi:hypothetical protein